MTHLRLGVIIPTYNEQKRIQKAFDALEIFVSEHPGIIDEVIFVDDGSLDETKSSLELFSLKQVIPTKIIHYKKNKGKGYAVRQGMLSCVSDYCLMIDADMSTSFDEILQCIPLMEEGKPIIIGTRKDRGAVLVKKQPWYRQGMGDFYAVLARCLTHVDIKDFGCGFKLFSRQAAHDIYQRTIINRWTFDTEVLFLARKLEYSFVEVGVKWKNDEDTRVSVLRDSLQSIIDLLRMVFNHRSLR